jgi:hypothetical protein
MQVQSKVVAPDLLASPVAKRQTSNADGAFGRSMGRAHDGHGVPADARANRNALATASPNARLRPDAEVSTDADVAAPPDVDATPSSRAESETLTTWAVQPDVVKVRDESQLTLASAGTRVSSIASLAPDSSFVSAGSDSDAMRQAATALLVATPATASLATAAAGAWSVDLSGTVPVESSATVPVDLSGTVPAETSVTVPVDLSATVLVETSVTVPVDLSATVPLDLSGTVPVDLSATVPLDLSGTVPVESSATVPVESLGARMSAPAGESGVAAGPVGTATVASDLLVGQPAAAVLAAVDDAAPAPIAVESTMMMRPVSTGSEVALPASTSLDAAAAPAGPAIAQSASSIAGRVEAAVAALRNAPPPREAVLDVDGLRVTVRLVGDVVHVSTDQRLQGGLGRELSQALAGRGLQLGQDQNSQGETSNRGEGQTAGGRQAERGNAQGGGPNDQRSGPLVDDSPTRRDHGVLL